MDKEILKNYRILCEEITMLEKEIEDLLNRGVILTDEAGESDPTFTATVKITDLRKILQKQRDKCCSLRLEIERVINGLERPIERLLMRKRYIEGKRWQQIALEMNYSYRHITKMHERILASIKDK